MPVSMIQSFDEYRHNYQQILNDMRWELFPRPVYSLDLTSSDFHVFKIEKTTIWFAISAIK